jgi:hypothetical protein
MLALHIWFEAPVNEPSRLRILKAEDHKRLPAWQTLFHARFVPYLNLKTAKDRDS